MSSLDFDAPAITWLESLPLGNGRIGAMLDGGTSVVRFEINDETGWSGSPSSEARQPAPTAAEAAALLAEARTAVADGRFADADAPLKKMQSSYSQAFLPFATLELALENAGEISGYRRSLDLRTGVHTVSYAAGGTPVTHTSFVSAPDGVLVHVLEGVGATLSVSTPHRVTAVDPLTFRLPSDVSPGHEPAFPDVSWGDESLEGALLTRLVVEASGRTLVLATTATTYAAFGEPLDLAAASARLGAAAALGSDALLARHVADTSAVLGRVTLDVGAPAAATVPERLAVSDPTLAGSLFDYGRYLLFSSSRAGGLPATLQGIWNNEMQPPWSSNYTININTQMNYWQAEVANLSETAEPLVAFVEALAAAGAEPARRLYNARGWVAHHNSDAWHFTSMAGAGAGNPSWAFWPMAGPWLVRHLWEHVAFGAAEPGFLEKRAWPLLRSTAEFLLDTFVELPDGTWGTSPSTSPENTYLDQNGAEVAVTASSAMDLQLVADVFELVVEAARRLGRDDDTVVREVEERRRMVPVSPVVTATGIVREWATDVVEADPHHRHVSSLYALYPGNGRLDAAQREAVAATLESRGDDSTGWSLVWKIALWARLGRGDRVDDVLGLVLRPAGSVEGPWAGGLYPNLFAAAPPFQIDGNLGFVAAIAECLVQSHAGFIDLLPAVPASLGSGTVVGLIARPGVEVSLGWHDGELVSAAFRARADTVATIAYRGRILRRDLAAGIPLSVSRDDFEESSITT
jgi:alpha-L-fucosidase 2